MGQSNASMKTALDIFFTPYEKLDLLTKELVKEDYILTELLKPAGEKGVANLNTFPNRSVKIPVNAEYPVTYDNRRMFDIEFGDTKQGLGSKNYQHAEFTAVDKGFTVQVTDEDLQLLDYKNSGKFSNWVEQYMNGLIQGFKVSLLDSAINGAGSTSTRADGLTKPDFDGWTTAIGSGTYGSLTTASYYEWQSQLWDCTTLTTVHGHTVGTIFATIAASITATGGRTPFFDVLNKSLQQCKRYAPVGKRSRYAIIMHPAVYDYCFLPSLEAQMIANVGSTQAYMKNKEGNMVNPQLTGMSYMIDGTPVYAEAAMLPNASIGSAPSYIMPANSIYIINLDFMHLEANDKKNFVFDDWEYIKNAYGVMQKSMTTTLMYYHSNRYCMGKITLPAAFTTLCTAAYGI